MIETLVVDLGGVAARFWPERRLQALATLSNRSPEEVQARWFSSGLEAQAERGAFRQETLLARLNEVLGRQLDRRRVVEAWALAFELDPAVLEFVQTSSLPAVIFTNNGPMLDLCIDGPLSGLAVGFGQVICSWHVGACKPESLAFERVAARLGGDPARLLLLDDDTRNVEAAVACGWQARRVTSAEELGQVVTAVSTDDAAGHA